MVDFEKEFGKPSYSTAARETQLATTFKLVYGWMSAGLALSGVIAWYAFQSGLVERIRAQEGNEGYAYFLPLDDPETVLLIDRWRDQAALDAHHRSPMMARIAALREKYHLRLRVERYRDE